MTAPDAFCNPNEWGLRNETNLYWRDGACRRRKDDASGGNALPGGATRRLGRVDHQDAFLDTDEQERARGITIFSKQAELALPEADITFLDTPGHVDFSAEMERTLQVLDYALLLVSGTDGVQSHTRTLWQLLRRYQIPTIVFVNKMDLPGKGRDGILQELRQELSENCAAFDADEAALHEELSLLDEALMEQVLKTGQLEDAQIADLIAKRARVPVLFWCGAAAAGSR